MPVINMFLHRLTGGLVGLCPLFQEGARFPSGGLKRCTLLPEHYCSSQSLQKSYLAWEEKILSSLFFFF